MINIISHRGLWYSKGEQNTISAFKKSFHYGFGIETDIRDLDGELVISHDPPLTKPEKPISLQSLLSLYVRYDKPPTLALNIKSDGLHNELKTSLERFKITNYFVFDMSIPDSLTFINSNISFYARQSEYESIPSLYNKAKGIWMDEFKEHWITEKVITDHIYSGKKVCIVSPELHNRSFEKEWIHYKEIAKEFSGTSLYLCTDHPLQANEFFNK